MIFMNTIGFVSEIIYHLSISLLVAVLFTNRLNWQKRATICVIFGLFIDLDHLFDYGYYMVKFRQSFSLAEFASGSHFQTSGKLFILFHSWELTAALIVSPLYSKWKTFSGNSLVVNLKTTFLALSPYQLSILLAGLAMFWNLAADQLVNDVGPWTYFWIYRVAIGFNNVIK